MAREILDVLPLTIEAFEPFGDVIEPDNAEEIRLINGGTTTRFHDLARVDVSAEGGRTLVNIFRGKPFALPVEIAMMERHPLGSQAFVPLHDRPFLILVAPDDGGRPGRPVAFVARGGQGVNYARNTWHHPLIALDVMSDFLVIDRGGEGVNLEEAFYPAPFRIEALQGH
jgi:ureidoglycolate lyase